MTLLLRFAEVMNIEIRGTIQENGNSRLDLIEIHVAELDDFGKPVFDVFNFNFALDWEIKFKIWSFQSAAVKW